jgi:hypothetical protein
VRAQVLVSALVQVAPNRSPAALAIVSSAKASPVLRLVRQLLSWALESLAQMQARLAVAHSELVPVSSLLPLQVLPEVLMAQQSRASSKRSRPQQVPAAALVQLAAQESLPARQRESPAPKRLSLRLSRAVSRHCWSVVRSQVSPASSLWRASLQVLWQPTQLLRVQARLPMERHSEPPVSLAMRVPSSCP